MGVGRVWEGGAFLAAGCVLCFIRGLFCVSPSVLGFGVCVSAVAPPSLPFLASFFSRVVAFVLVILGFFAAVLALFLPLLSFLALLP
jgi:hypothetical protein